MTNLEIAQAATLQPIADIARSAGLSESEYEPLGRTKGKLTDVGIARLKESPPGKLVLVTAITPTPAGEGKTTTAVGLTQGLNHIGRSAVVAIREPSLGPVFGVKGGACGGGYSQVLPMEEINLFFNGDFPAIAAAHNLLAAMVDAHIHNGNALGLDVTEPMWPRTVDMNDRALRHVVIGLGSSNGVPREAGFVITAASEVMAVLCMARSFADLKERLGRIVVGMDGKRRPVTASEIGAVGAMAALLRDAIRPNLVQTIEGGPALVHGGPFANIAHGCSSLISIECGLGLSEFTVTEGGFAADLGAQKFLNLLCPQLGRGPDVIVLVATVRALEHHGEGAEDPLRAGCENLFRHVDHLRRYGPPVLVSVNRFRDDTDEELARLVAICAERGVEAIIADPVGSGGPGCAGVAERVAALAAMPSEFRPIVVPEDGLVAQLETIVREVYGGDGIVLSEEAEKRLKWLKKHGMDRLPVCVAKTQYSLSAEADLRNAPTGFRVKIQDFKVSAGAGFVVAVAGSILLMPGLGKTPAAFGIDVDADGKITGLF